MNKPLRILIWILIYFISLEVILRAGGFLFTFQQDLRNQKNVVEGATLKVMCLGDSNTAVGAEESYPSQLETVLNEKSQSQKFEVFNQGIPAADSTIILQSVDKMLNEHDPDIVVVMMGVNDRYVLKSKTVFFFDRIFGYLKVYHLAHNLLSKGADRFKSLIDFPKETKTEMTQEPITEDDARKLVYAVKLNHTQGYIQAEFLLKDLLSRNVEGSFMDRVRSELGIALYYQGKFHELLSVIDYFLSGNEFHILATDYVREMCTKRIEEKGMLTLLERLVKDNPQSIALNGMLGACYADYGYPQKGDIYLAKIKELREEGENIVLKTNYLKLHQMLKERGIKEVFVQYPNRSIESLKNIFQSVPDAATITFVENEENFKESRDPSKYQLYFTDRKCDDFGHATRLGNHILASQIAEAILKDIK